MYIIFTRLLSKGLARSWICALTPTGNIYLGFIVFTQFPAGFVRIWCDIRHTGCAPWEVEREEKRLPIQPSWLPAQTGAPRTSGRLLCIPFLSR